MNLVIDNGNTASKVAVFDHNNIVFVQTCKNLTLAYIRQLEDKYSVQNAILSVVGKADAEVTAYFRSSANHILLSSNTPVPVNNDYEAKTTLGNDRLAAAVGATVVMPGQNVLVIDAGTAITYDLVSAEGTYLGGNISPGIDLRFKALHNYTAQLPLLEFKPVNDSYGKNTETAILVGVIEGTKNEIHGFIKKYRENFRNLNILFTGGYANLFDNSAKNHIFAEPNLVLIGLNRILNYNA